MAQQRRVRKFGLKPVRRRLPYLERFLPAERRDAHDVGDCHRDRAGHAGQTVDQHVALL